MTAISTRKPRNQRKFRQWLLIGLGTIALGACGVGEIPAGPGGGGGSGDGPDATPGGGGGGGDTPDAEPLANFSFFVTSMDGILALAGSQQGFGGDLGGLAGADAICQQLATNVGVGAKTWRAFLSVTNGGDGQPVHAIERIGSGPWYDRNGRLVANDIAGLLQERPAGDPQITSDLPDEHGVGIKSYGDSHDILTGSNDQGRLESTDPVSTCQDWTSAVGPGSENQVRAGHAWPAASGQHWIRAHRLRGCAAGVNLVQNGAGTGDCVGCSGGYGGIYCFALTP